MKIKRKRTILVIVVLFLLLLFFLSSSGNTYGIFRDTLNTKVYLTVLDTSSLHTITFNTHGGTPVPEQQTRATNEPAGTLPTNITLEGYNFLGWFDNYPNGNPISSDTPVTGDVTYHAHWAPIVCKKATVSTPLHTETCQTGGSCLDAGYSLNDTITYGTYPGSGSPLPGDAYDCDVQGNGTYERFYYIRKNSNNAVLVYYTSIDENGDNLLSSSSGDTYKYIDSQNTAAPDVLPTSSTWAQTELVTFNGKVARFPSVADLEAACGASPIGASDKYLSSCKYFMENSKFQASALGVTGIWVNPYNNNYYEMDTELMAVQTTANGADSENAVRPVIEIPYESLEGYQVVTQYNVTFHYEDDGDTPNYILARYDGQAIGSLPIPDYREGYAFAGWYTDNTTFTTEVTPNMVITSATHVYAKWVISIDNMKYAFRVPGTCKFNGANHAITSTTNDCISTINPTGSNIDYTASAHEYIDTQIPLYNTTNYDLDYEIGFTIVAVNLGQNSNQASFVSAKLENTAEHWPGIVFRKSTNNKLELTQTINNNKKQANNLAISTNLTEEDDPIDVRIYRKSGVISFVYNGGTETTLQDISTGNKDTFEFYTWFGASGLEDTTVTPAVPQRTDTTAGAQRHITATLSNMYIKLEKTDRLVTFDASPGTPSFGSKSVDAGTAVGELPTATRSMYRFDGWYTKPEGQGGTLIDTSTIIVKDTTFYAHYTPKYLVTFDPGTDGTLSIEPETTIAVASGDTITNWPTASKPGYIFDGWLDSQNNPVDENTVITGDVTFHAKYIDIRRVDLNAHGGTLSPNISYIEIGDGQVLDVSSLPTASLAGHVFNGWWTAETGGTQITTNQTITQNVEYHAQYKVLHEITFDPDGGALSIAPETSIQVVDGESIGSANLPTAQLYGYSFNGWFTQTGSGGTQYDGTEIIHSTATYYAQYTQLTGPTRTVTFYDGETVYDSVDVIDGNFLGPYMVSDPTKEDYFFNGWFINGNQLSPFTSETVVTGGNLNVMASWRQSVKLASVTTNPSPMYIRVGGTGQITVTHTQGDLLENVSYTSSDTTVASVTSNGTVTGVGTGTATITILGAESNETRTVEVTVHDNLLVTFDSNNGDDPTEIWIPSGSTLANYLQNDPTQANYIFDDWYLYDTTNDEFTDTKVDPTHVVTQDETYKASWAETDRVASIGRSYFQTLAEAFEAAPENIETEVKILQDILNINCSKTTAPNACVTNGRTQVPQKKKIILIGGDHTVSTGASTVNNVILVLAQGQLTVKSGTYISTKDKIAVFETNSGGILYIDGGTITNAYNRGAVYNSGTLVVNGGTISTTSAVTIRPVLQNAGKNSSITINGGTITQYATSVSTTSGNDGRGAVAITYANDDCASKIYIYGGTIVSHAQNGAAVNIPRGSLTIGTSDNNYDISSPVIQGEYYGIYSDVDYSVYDGIIKGKLNSSAVNDTTKITGTETGSVLIESTDDGYNTLYYELN